MMTIKKAILPLLFLSISTSITAGVVVESTYKMTGINVQGHVIDSKTKELQHLQQPQMLKVFIRLKTFHKEK